MVQVKFCGDHYTIFKGRYQDSERLALELQDKDGDLGPMATVNVPHIPLKPNEIIIKNYSENEGLLETLIKAGIVRPVRQVPCNHAVVDVCELLIPEDQFDDLG